MTGNRGFLRDATTTFTNGARTSLTRPWPTCLRSFLAKSYPTMKKANPDIPILLREASGTMPAVYARFGAFPDFVSSDRHLGIAECPTALRERQKEKENAAFHKRNAERGPGAQEEEKKKNRKGILHFQNWIPFFFWRDWTPAFANNHGLTATRHGKGKVPNTVRYCNWAQTIHRLVVMTEISNTGHLALDTDMTEKDVETVVDELTKDEA